jgi:hypothetical protein
MEQKAVVDRSKDGTWTLLLVDESETGRVIPVEQLPEDATEGTWLRIRIEADVIMEIVVDAAETCAAREPIRSKLDALRQRKRHFQPIISEDERSSADTPGEEHVEAPSEE